MNKAQINKIKKKKLIAKFDIMYKNYDSKIL